LLAQSANNRSSVVCHDGADVKKPAQGGLVWDLMGQ